jgi:adenylate cyclase
MKWRKCIQSRVCSDEPENTPLTLTRVKRPQPPAMKLSTHLSPRSDPPFSVNSSLDLRPWSSQQRLIVVVDLVESVRLMQSHEQATLTRWLSFTHTVLNNILPDHQAKFVKGMGDGLLLQLSDAHQLEALTRRMHAHFAQINPQLPQEEQMWLRIGCHVADVFAVDQDIYGSGVNLASRIASLAGPGQTVVSVQVRDLLVDGLDADLTDMGDCYLKHVQGSIRVYRLSQVSESMADSKGSDLPIQKPTDRSAADLSAVVAVLPFQARRLNRDDDWAIGDMIAENVIGQLAQTQNLRLMSLLSTQALAHLAHAGQHDALREQYGRLGVHYALTGSYVTVDQKIIVSAELSNARDHQVVWTDRLQGRVEELLELQCELCQKLADAVHQTILQREAKAAEQQPLPSLQSHTLLLTGVHLMFKTSDQEFQRSQAILHHLLERHNASHQPLAWLAKTYVLQASQRMHQDGTAQGNLNSSTDYCRYLVKRAVDFAPQSSFAHAISGLVSYHLLHDFDQAQMQLDQALALNPSEALAWLYKGMLHAFRAEAQEGLAAVKRACQLSPLDPNRHYFDALTASAHLTAQNYDQAVAHASRAIAGNVMHLSAHRCLVIAQVLRGDVSSAQNNAQRLMALAPHFTVSAYLNNFKDKQFKLGETFAQALSRAGVPM